MSKSKLGMSSIEINKKFGDGKECYRYAKRLKEYIRYICKKNCWQAQAMIVCSNLKKEVSHLEYNISGKRGRPKKELVIDEIIANNWYKGDYHTDWHIHILLVSKPSYTFRNAIKKYIDKNWIKIDNIYEKEEFDISKLKNKKVYKKNCNIKIADYFMDQSDRILFCNDNYSNEEDLKYTLRQYHNEYLKMNSAKRKLYRENAENYMGEEMFIKRLNKIQSKFDEIEKYYFNINKEEKEEREKEYMRKVKIDKIASNYENIENDNKVQKNNNRIMNNNYWF